MKATRPDRIIFFKATTFYDDLPPAPAPAPVDPPPAPSPERKFTQDEVNRMIKADKDKAKKDRDDLLSQLNSIREQGLTPELKQELEDRIQNLENQGKTKEQIARDEMTKKEKEWLKEKEQYGHKLTAAEKRYAAYRSRVDIKEACRDKVLLGERTAFNPDQIVELLGPKTYMFDELGEDGKPTGELVPRVKLSVTTKDGKTEIRDLPVTEAVKWMAEQEEYSNLFNSGATGGIGGGAGVRRTLGSAEVPTDTGDFMNAWKKDGGKTITANVQKKPAGTR